MVLSNQRPVVLVRPAQVGLVLQVLHYPDLVKACPGGVPSCPEAASAELHLAGLLIDAASGVLDWAGYRDDTAQELRGLVEAKLHGQAAVAESLPLVLPLLQALEQSVATPKRSGRRRRQPRPRPQPRRPRPRPRPRGLPANAARDALDPRLRSQPRTPKSSLDARPQHRLLRSLLRPPAHAADQTLCGIPP